MKLAYPAMLALALATHKYWDLASCRACSIKSQCTLSENRRITRWKHEAVIDAMQRRMPADAR